VIRRSSRQPSLRAPSRASGDGWPTTARRWATGLPGAASASLGREAQDTRTVGALMPGEPSTVPLAADPAHWPCACSSAIWAIGMSSRLFVFPCAKRQGLAYDVGVHLAGATAAGAPFVFPSLPASAERAAEATKSVACRNGNGWLDQPLERHELAAGSANTGSGRPRAVRPAGQIADRQSSWCGSRSGVDPTGMRPVAAPRSLTPRRSLEPAPAACWLAAPQSLWSNFGALSAAERVWSASSAGALRSRRTPEADRPAAG